MNFVTVSTHAFAERVLAIPHALCSSLYFLVAEQLPPIRALRQALWVRLTQRPVSRRHQHLE